MKSICAPSMPDLWRTGRSREGRTHGTRSEEEYGAGMSQPPPAHTEGGRQSPPDKHLVFMTRTKTPGQRNQSHAPSCSKPGGQNTKGPVLPMGPWRRVSPLTAPQEKRVPLPSRLPGVCVCEGRLSPLTDPGSGAMVAAPVPLPHGPRGSGCEGCGSRSLTEAGRRKGRPVLFPSRTRTRRQRGVHPPPLTEPGGGGGVSVPLPHGGTGWGGPALPLPSRSLRTRSGCRVPAVPSPGSS